jgi:hypothetical protein
MVKYATVLFVVALQFTTASFAQQPPFRGHNGPPLPGHPVPGYPHDYRYPQRGGMPGLVPGLLLGLGVGMIPFLQQPAPARAAPGGYPQPNASNGAPGRTGTPPGNP